MDTNSTTALSDDNSGTVFSANNEVEHLRENIESILSDFSSKISEKVEEEVIVTLLSLKEVNVFEGVSDAGWYISKGVFTGRREVVSIIAFPSQLALGITKDSSVDGKDSSKEKVKAGLKDLGHSLIGIIASTFDNLVVSMNDFDFVEDIASATDENMGFIRAEFSIDKSVFYIFLSNEILYLFSKNEEEKMETDDIMTEVESLVKKEDSQDEASSINKDKEGDNPDETSLMGQEETTQIDEIMSDVGGDIKEEQPENKNDGDALPESKQTQDIASILSGTSNSSESSSGGNSLGEELLSDASLLDVELPSFEKEETSFSNNDGQKIDMLMDVKMQVAVELGHTERTVSEILGLSRGAILELHKLAGEPLDIKVNNKLIARGEAVVIDENFGVRIVEIINSTIKKNKK